MAVGLIVVSLVAVILWKTYIAGRRAVEQEHAVQRLEGLRKKVKAHDKIERMSRSDRREYLDQWMRD